MAPSILKTLTAAAGLYASLAMAAPMHKRAIVWETEVEVVVETVTVTTTCSGTPGPDVTIPPPSITQEQPEVTTTFAPSTASASISSPASTSSSSPPPPPPPSPPTSSAVPPPPPPPPAPTTTSKPTTLPPQFYPEPTPTTTTTPPPPPPPVQTYAPPPVAPSVTPKPPKPSPTPSPSPSPSPSPPSYGGDGECSASEPCEGEITFYDGGLGACGSNVDSESEDAIALPFGFMGAESNTNKYCGKTVTIKHKGITSTATIKDKCMGCTGRSIDMTRHLFYKFGTEDDGRLDDAEWWINE